MAAMETLLDAPTKDPKTVLKDVFGYSTFRDGQLEIIQSSLAGQDTLVLLPTGVENHFAIKFQHCCLKGLRWLFPLISLMQDQVAQLKAQGVAAEYINNSVAWEQQRATYEGLQQGTVKLLYVAPEKALQRDFIERSAAAMWLYLPLMKPTVCRTGDMTFALITFV